MFKAFLKILRPYWFFIILSPICILGEVYAYTKLPQLLSLIIDQGIIALNMDVVKTYGLQMIIFTILEAIFSLVGLWCGAKVSTNATTDLRQKLFTKIQNFSFPDLDHFGIGSLITRLTGDITIVQNTLFMLLRLALRAPIMLVACVFMLLKINTSLSGILLIGAVVLLVTVIVLLKVALPLFIKSQKQLDNLNSVTEENLNAIKTIKAFVREKFVSKKFTVVNGELTATLLKVAVAMTIVMPIIMTVLNLSVVAVVWFGSHALEAKTMEIGNLVAFINYAEQILVSFMMVSFVFIMVMRANASVQRLGEILRRQVTLKDPAKPLASHIRAGKIEFKNVDFAFHNQHDADNLVLKNLNFTLQSGQKLGVIGSTGAGKTTLVNLMMRFYDVTNGQILIDDIDVRDYKLKTLRENIGIVLQDGTLFSGSIKDNLYWGNAHATDEMLQQFTHLAQAESFINAKEKTYDYPLARAATNLSGGQKQRLNIARALLKKSQILIFDDATSAVDLQTEKLIQNGIKNLPHQLTTIVVGQRISSIMDSDLILVLDEGKIVGQGTHDALLEKCTIYRDIYNSQLGEGSK
jgi:ATP-binding cassette subfamily B protein